MRAVLRSLATVVLAATVPVLVIGAPPRILPGDECLSVINDLTSHCGPGVRADACIEQGTAGCMYDVRYVDANGEVQNDRLTATPEGKILAGPLSNSGLTPCKAIQCKHCVSCPSGPCRPDSPCF